LTNLTKKAMPMIRYWTNDITSLYYDPDSNRNMVKMNPIVGRADDMLIIRGVNVYPSQIEEVFKHIEGIIPNYYLTPIEKQAMNIRLEVDVELSNDLIIERNLTKGSSACDDLFEEFAKKVRQEIKKRVGITTNVIIHEEGELPKNRGGKIDRILKKKQMMEMRNGGA